MSKDLETIEEVLELVYNNGRMADWKVAGTSSSDILPWLTNEQALQSIQKIIKRDVMANNTEDVELRESIGNLHAYNYDGDDTTISVMVDSDNLDTIAEYVEYLIQQEANRQVIKELEWAKTASVWNIEARVKELKEQTNGE